MTISVIENNADNATNPIGSNNANNAFSSSSVVADADGSVLERLEKLEANFLAFGDKCVQTAAGNVAQTGNLTLFTVAGGPIQIIEIVGIVTTSIQSGTHNWKLNCLSTVGSSSTDISANDDYANSAAGRFLTITGTFATAGSHGAVGAAVAQATLTRMPPGVIRQIADSSPSGQVQWFLRYRPIGTGVTVTAAF